METGSLQLSQKTMENLVKSAKERGIAPKALIVEVLNSLYGQAGKAVILDLSGLEHGQKLEMVIKRPEKPKAEKLVWYRRIWRALLKDPKSARRMKTDSRVLKGAGR